MSVAHTSGEGMESKLEEPAGAMGLSDPPVGVLEESRVRAHIVGTRNPRHVNINARIKHKSGSLTCQFRCFTLYTEGVAWRRW
jgi:hypothetical protein